MSSLDHRVDGLGGLGHLQDDGLAFFRFAERAFGEFDRLVGLFDRGPVRAGVRVEFPAQHFVEHGGEPRAPAQVLLPQFIRHLHVAQEFVQGVDEFDQPGAEVHGPIP